MKKVLALCLVLVASGGVATACAKSSQNTGDTSASPATSSTLAANTSASANLPIPLDKLPSEKVATGNVASGAKLFDSNCSSCHSTRGKNSMGEPSLAGVGFKAGQVAYMIDYPQGVDKQSTMPALHLPAKKVADIAAYVASLKE